MHLEPRLYLTSSDVDLRWTCEAPIPRQIVQKRPFYLQYCSRTKEEALATVGASRRAPPFGAFGNVSDAANASRRPAAILDPLTRETGE